MNCSDTMPLLDADIDGELDLVRHLEVAAHLRGCVACTRAAEAARVRGEAVRGHLTRFAAPPRLAVAVRRSLPAAPAVRRVATWSPVMLGGLAAALAACVLFGYGWGVRRGRGVALIDEAVADHVRSLMAAHLTDVASTDRHTVKPWFSGKLDFSPPVVDLVASDFPLIGGRLEEVAGHPAAALVYRRRLHTINLFIWPEAAGTIATGRDRRQGFQIDAWSRDGLNFIAVSEIPADELAEFAREFRAHTP